jgi:hypothetical protein
MPVTARRLAVAGVLTATAIAVPAVALAGNNPTTKTPTPAQTTAAPAGAKPKPQGGGATGPSSSAVAARLASQLGVTKTAAEHALQQLQRNITHSTFAAVAHELGVTPAQLNAALREVKLSFAPPGSSARPSRAHQKTAGPHGRSLTSRPAAAAALASRLGVSLAAAQQAMHQIGVLAARNGGGIESDSPQLAAIAHHLGVSRAALNNALRAVKVSFADR